MTTEAKIREYTVGLNSEKIGWCIYDPKDRSIESQDNHLVTDGRNIMEAQHASIPGTGINSWRINNSLINSVTHWASINNRNVPG
ncbi:hypothetical protein [Paenibacillus sp. AGC30]